ncbi:MAG: cell envelope integrity protein CreD, partial [Myxococcota bacterium]
RGMSAAAASPGCLLLKRRIAMATLPQWISNRGALKIAGLGGLALALLVPLQMVDDLIGERSSRERGVKEELGQRWGSEVELSGPFLEIPGEAETLYLLPTRNNAVVTLDVLERYRGIFRYPTYSAHIEFDAQFELPALRSSLDFARAAWVLIGEGAAPPAFLSVTDGDGTTTQIARRGGDRGLSGHWVYRAPANVAWNDGPATLSGRFSAPGAESFTLKPMSANATISVDGNWGTPSFVGDRLPDARRVSEDSFGAEWKLAATHGLAYWDGVPSAAQFPVVGARLLQPVSQYQVVTRTVKYAFLVIVLTFASFFLFEAVSGLHIHLVQYLLVGLALVMFYLLLLSQSEHMGFGFAYLIAAAAVVVLITTYTAAVLSNFRSGLLSGSGLAAVYGILYPILRDERYALLTGSWALFLVLATVMIVTRKFDWGAVGRRELVEQEGP